MADLGGWLAGDYRVPGEPPADAEDDGEPDDDRDR
jgi:endogenous inhibitor of DNA gyrase (YacG/DUF329 family)